MKFKPFFLLKILAISSVMAAENPNTVIQDANLLVQEIVNANYHKESCMHSLQLLKVDPDFFAKLQEEVLDLTETFQPSTVNDQGHVTKWTRPFGIATQYSLLNKTGDFSDFSSDHNRSIKGKSFHHEQRYPNLAKFVSFFPHATNFRINVMGAKSGLSQHEEDICHFHNVNNTPLLRVRFHLPIVTNPDCELFVEGDLYHFDEGMIYYFHNGCVHASQNKDPSNIRIHIVWDMLLTRETYDLMFLRSTGAYMAKVDDVYLPPIGSEPIDPNYASTKRIMDYGTARTITLCQLQ